jgi:hypothetical protein
MSPSTSDQPNILTTFMLLIILVVTVILFSTRSFHAFCAGPDRAPTNDAPATDAENGISRVDRDLQERVGG